MRSHVWNGRGLPRRLGRRHGRRRPHVSRGGAAIETAPDLLRDLQLTAREGARASDCDTRTIVIRGRRLEQPQDALGAVRRPCRNDPSVSQAQRLRRSHSMNMPAARTPRGGSGWRCFRSEPPHLGGAQHRLGAVNDVELAVCVVEVGSDRARREAEVQGDPLVDLAFSEGPQDVGLPARER
jgi:hypothetical protein